MTSLLVARHLQKPVTSSARTFGLVDDLSTCPEVSHMMEVLSRLAVILLIGHVGLAPRSSGKLFTLMDEKAEGQL